MTTDGGLDRWGSNGPMVWHSENSGLDRWHVDGVWSDYQAAPAGGDPEGSLIGGKLIRGGLLLHGVLGR